MAPTQDSRGPIEAITLDVTRTLIFPQRVAETYREVLTRHGLDPDLDALQAALTTVWHELACVADPRHDRFAAAPGGARGWWQRFLERAVELLGLDPPSRFAASELFDRFAQGEAWDVYPEVFPVLRTLRARGMRLAVISNFDERLPRILGRLRLAPFFETIVFSQEIGVEKPHPKIFQAALRRLALPPERVVHVGDDALNDIEGATAVGMASRRVERSRGQDLRQVLDPWLPAGPEARRSGGG